MKPNVAPDIQDDEWIYRTIFTPYHYDVKKNQLKKEAYIQKPNSKGVSTYRGAILDKSEVRQKSLDLAQLSTDPKKSYFGICVLTALAVRNAGSLITDSRNIFYGHADIFHDIPDAPPGEPNTPEDRFKLLQAVEKLIACTRVFIDQNPDAESPDEYNQLAPKC